MSDEHVETGIVAAAVTMAAMPAPPPPVADPEILQAAVALTAPAVVMPEGWTLFKIASLVADVAQNMYEISYILKKHGLTAEQYKYLQANEYFQKCLESEVIAWSGANSIQKRLALEAAIALETALPTVAARLSKSTEPLSDVVSLVKVLAEISGLIGTKAAAAQGQGGNGTRVKIEINLGADTFTREATVTTSAVPADGEGPGNDQALHALVKRT